MSPPEETTPAQPPAEGPQAPPEPPAPQPDPALADRVQALEARERELVDRLARLQADFDNFRRRTREDLAQAAGRGKESLLKVLLPVLDNLDRALAHSDDAGLRMIARQLHETLGAQGVLVLDPAGEPFDAKIHEAVAEETKDGAKAGVVTTVLEKGYTLDGRVLRPARVVVAK